MEDYCKRSGQIPTFGDWDYSNQMPITQYFECARQAGLLRYSSSSGESDPYLNNNGAASGDLYAVVDFKKPSRNIVPPPRKTRMREKRGSNVKEQKKQVKKVCDVTEPQRKHQQQQMSISNSNKLHHQNGVVGSAPPPTTTASRPRRLPKAVDEDLYKIPPELLHSSKRKKMPAFFSCLVPACGS